MPGSFLEVFLTQWKVSGKGKVGQEEGMSAFLQSVPGDVKREHLWPWQALPACQHSHGISHLVLWGQTQSCLKEKLRKSSGKVRFWGSAVPGFRQNENFCTLQMLPTEGPEEEAGIDSQGLFKVWALVSP